MVPNNFTQVTASSDSLGAQPRGIVAVDLDGDGCLDVATRPGAQTATLLFCVPASKTFAPSPVTLPEPPLCRVAGLFNRDAMIDLAVSLPSGNLAVLTNQRWR